MLRAVAAPRPAMLASRTSSTSAIADTETVVVSATIPAGTLQAGDTFRIIAGGVHTNTTTPTTGSYRVRIGPTTLTGVLPAVATLAYGGSARTDVEFMVHAQVTFRTVGASGTAIGGVATSFIVSANTNGAITSPVTVDTTVDNLIELTYQSGGASSTETYTHGSISKV